jgi:hypothetical protein
VRSKSLKIFQDPDYDFVDVRVFKDGQVCKCRDLLGTDTFQTYFTAQENYKSNGVKLMVKEKMYEGG